MSELPESLRRAAATPTRDPSVAELQEELRHRHRRRRVAMGVLTGVGVLAASAVLVTSLQGDGQSVVSATGEPATPTTVQAPLGRAHLGDGFCEPQLTNAGYRISPARPDVVPALTEGAAIEQARVYVGNDSGTFSAYFAMVRNPVADHAGLGSSDVPRATWVVEVSGVVPSPPTGRGGVPNPNLYPSYRMVAFIDDATGTRAGAWSACYEESQAAALVDIPNVLGVQVVQATAWLAQLGLKVAIQEERSSDVPRGVVMGQDPPAGSRSAVGSQVVLELSSGP